MDNEKNDALDQLSDAVNAAALDDLAESFSDYINTLKNKQEEYWNSLTKEQQLDVFCAVVRRICQGELDDKGTYRYVLYDIFKFGPESYGAAQMAGFLDLHNQILAPEALLNTVEHFAEFAKVDQSVIDQYIKENSWVLM